VKLSTVPEGLSETLELDSVHDGTVKVNLGANQDRVDVDFWFTPPGESPGGDKGGKESLPLGSIGDFIFLDANGDGDQAGDKGISGVYHVGDAGNRGKPRRGPRPNAVAVTLLQW